MSEKNSLQLIPLLKTIAFALPEENKFYNLKQKLKKGAINYAKKTPDIISSIISKYVSDDVGKFTKECFDSLKKEFNSKIELLAEIDMDTLYFDGFEDIKKEIQKINRENPKFKIVVFIDDLDRCSPFKTLEVLESIKVFLGMEGFIYILGLSHDIISKLIDIKYEKSGIKGEEYIKKMIQIPINLPKWNHQDIVDLITYFINEKIIHEKFNNILVSNIDLISIAIENNPREIKRFLNKFIVAHEIFSSSIRDYNPHELMIIQSIQLRWNSLYNFIIKADKKIIDELAYYTNLDDEERLEILSQEVKDKEKFDNNIRKTLNNFIDEPALWSFLKRNYEWLLKIKDLGKYRRATQAGIDTNLQRLKLEELLRKGLVSEFNNIREKQENFITDLSGVYLGHAKLSGVNLSYADLSNANLENANLTKASLRFTYLNNANLRNSILIHATLRNSILTKTNLEYSNLNCARLANVIFNETNLSGADLSEAIIVNPHEYSKMILNTDTKIKDIIIDEPNFVEKISNHINFLPIESIKNKAELEKKLKKSKCHMEDWKIDYYLGYSNLP